MTKYLEDNKEKLSIIIIIAMLYCRCIIGVHTTYAVILDCLVDGIALLFVLGLGLKNKELLKKSIFSIPVLWAIMFFGLLIVDKLLGRGFNFSTRVAVLTIGASILVYLILCFNSGRTKAIFTDVSEIMIYLNILTAMYYDRGTIGWWRGHVFARFGQTPGCRVLDTANLCTLFILPLLYAAIVDKKLKRYLPSILFTLLAIVVTGSKTAIICVFLMLLIFVLCGSATKKILYRNVAILIAFVIVGTILVFKVDIFYELLGARIVELLTAKNGAANDLTTSTGQRFMEINLALEHWTETPIFGHGFYDFLTKDYAKMEPVLENGVIVSYETGLIHCNFLELLFSFGLFGLAMYYWFPCTLIFSCIKNKKKDVKILVSAYLVSMLVIDACLDMYYKYIISYVIYFVIYCLLKENNEEQRHS